MKDPLYGQNGAGLVLYIAGPMRGYDDYNFPAFNKLASFLRRVYPKAEIINPAEMDEGDTGQSFQYYIKRDIQALLRCNTIVLLRGWHKSQGAALEAEVAKAIGCTGWTVDREKINRYRLGHVFGPRPHPEGALGNLLFGSIILEDVSPLTPLAAALQAGRQEIPSPEELPWNDEGPLEEGTKFDDRKPRMDLVPTVPLIGWSEILTFGANKYTDRNWERGIRFGRCYAAALRHLIAWWEGENNDPETGKSHLYHAMCNIGFLGQFMDQYKRYKRYDDRPTKEKDDESTGHSGPA